jgi:hypothetical protein
MFCYNYIVGGGTLIGADYFANGRLATDFPTLTGIAPGQPFIIEVFHLVSNGAGAHLAGAILVDPVAFVPVPGPVVGAGLPGLLLASVAFSAGGDGGRRSLEYLA